MLYSLGNLIFDQNWSTNTMESMLVEATFHGGELAQLHLRPYIIHNQSQPNFLDPQEGRGPSAAQGSARRFERLARLVVTRPSRSERRRVCWPTTDCTQCLPMLRDHGCIPVVAFGAGLASAASPCLIPLYPAFLAYLTRLRGRDAGSGQARRVSGFLGLAVLLGLLTSMMVIGLVVVAVSAPIGLILGYAVPLIDAPAHHPRSDAAGRHQPLHEAAVAAGARAPRAPSPRPTCTASSWDPSRCLALDRSSSSRWPSRSVRPRPSARWPRSSSSASASACRWCVLSVLARARQDTVVRFLARHHRAIEVISGVLLIGAGLLDLWVNWDSILLTFGL